MRSRGSGEVLTQEKQSSEDSSLKNVQENSAWLESGGGPQETDETQSMQEALMNNSLY